jgi:hypothetical protein
MQDRWIGKGINLKLLSEYLEQFFKSKGFLTIAKKSSEEYTISVAPRRAHNLCENVEVFIRGEPNDFLINFVSGSRSRLFVRLGGLTTFFGGGILYSRGLKSLDALKKLESDFWKFVDEKISVLSQM